ncbi:hypothetical protein ACFWVB_02490 [Streptomyces microflavus]
MAGTTAFVWVLIACCGVAVVAIIARAKVEIARIQGTESEPDQ